MGNILRSIANSDNSKSGLVKEYQARGELVPDEFVRLIAWDHLNKQDKSKGFLFDGYPRTLAQYEHVDDMLRKFGQKIDKVVYIMISEEEVIRRLSARRTCEKCGNIYNLITNPSPNGGKCVCGGKLVQRTDDKPEAIKKRLSWGYANEVKEVAEKNGVLLEIDGKRPIEVIHQDIVQKLGLA
jgi:adenylate kinase